MADIPRILAAPPVAPLRLPVTAVVRRRADNPLPRLGRLVWLLTALSLPVFGLTVVDLVHHDGERKTMQAAASLTPSGEVAAHSGAIPTAWSVGMASRPGTGRDIRG